MQRPTSPVYVPTSPYIPHNLRGQALLKKLSCPLSPPAHSLHMTVRPSWGNVYSSFDAFGEAQGVHLRTPRLLV
jgi:hypothetical protein